MAMMAMVMTKRTPTKAAMTIAMIIMLIMMKMIMESKIILISNQLQCNFIQLTTMVLIITWSSHTLVTKT